MPKDLWDVLIDEIGETAGNQEFMCDAWHIEMRAKLDAILRKERDAFMWGKRVKE